MTKLLISQGGWLLVAAIMMCMARTTKAFSFVVGRRASLAAPPLRRAVTTWRRTLYHPNVFRTNYSPFAVVTSSSSGGCLYSTTPTTHAEPELLHKLAQGQLEQKTFGGLSYMDTSSSKDFFRVVFVLGGPGAGKGTQSALLEENYPTVHLSVGELLRNEQTKPDSPYRQVIEQALVGGTIVPVEISLNLLQQAMREQDEQQIIYLVDGFPRNYDNLNGWCRVMNDVTALWSVLVYQCPLNVLEKRILKRAEDSGRSDDNLESLRKRFHTFEHDTMPIVETLRQACLSSCKDDNNNDNDDDDDNSSSNSSSSSNTQWAVEDIRGDRPLEEVWESTQNLMNRLILHDVVTANVALLDAVQRQDAQAYQDLCAPEWFVNKEEEEEEDVVKKVMQMQEEEEGNDDNSNNSAVSLSSSSVVVTDAKLEVITGKQVALSYTRSFEGQLVREKRIWSHEGVNGWRNVHFARTPAVVVVA